MRKGYINLPNVTYDPTNYKTIFAEDINEIVEEIEFPTHSPAFSPSATVGFFRLINQTLPPTGVCSVPYLISNWFGKVSLFIDSSNFLMPSDVFVTVNVNGVPVINNYQLVMPAPGRAQLPDIVLSYGDQIDGTISSAYYNGGDVTIDDFFIGFKCGMQPFIY